MKPPSARRPSAASAAERQASLPAGFTSSPVPRWAKMSPILPTVTTARPAFVATSRMVSAGGGVEKSLRFGVRVKPVAGEPTNGRAMTRPMRYGSHKRAGDAADLVQALKPERLLVRRDLEHAVDRGVADRLGRPDVLGAELVEDRGAGGVAVAEDAGELRLGDERLRELGRKGRLAVREIAPVEIDRHAGDLPVAGGRVLAARGLDAVAPSPGGLAERLEVRRHPPGRGLAGKPESQRDEVRQVQRALAQPGAVALPPGASLGDVADRVGAGIAIGRRILRPADADGVEHDDQRAGHRRRSLSSPRLRGEGFAPEGAKRARRARVRGCRRLRPIVDSPSPGRASGAARPLPASGERGSARCRRDLIRARSQDRR